jgi:hypothetical protein
VYLIVSAKGKVERGIGYVKGNFWPGISFEGLEDLNEQALVWLKETANSKICSETGEAPEERLKRENLKPIELVSRYDTSYIANLKAGRDFRVLYDGVWYSVPWQYAKKNVLLRAPLDSKMIFIYHNMKLIASHERCYRRYAKIIDENHAKGLTRSRRIREEKRDLTFQFLPPGPGVGIKRVSPLVEERALEVYERIARF